MPYLFMIEYGLNQVMDDYEGNERVRTTFYGTSAGNWNSILDIAVLAKQ